MRRLLTFGVLLVLLCFALPRLWLTLHKSPETPAPTPASPEAVTQLESGATLAVRQTDGTTVQMDMNAYLWGVVAAEMPASFEMEALKAQAVAARTYAMNRIGAQNQNHPDAAVCMDYRCCQAYISPQEALLNWGSSAYDNTQKILSAVQETERDVILYEGKLISALFHSSSAGQTVDAVQVWGNAVPYLVAVDSPEGEDVPNFSSTVRIPLEEFRQTCLATYPEADLSGSPEGWIADISRSAGGSVESLSVGGVFMRGAAFRSLCGLRSANFHTSIVDNSLEISVLGFGHGVGMSQYGANALAKSGKTYKEILSWYYTGVSVEACPEILWDSLRPTAPQ